MPANIAKRLAAVKTSAQKQAAEEATKTKAANTVRKNDASDRAKRNESYRQTKAERKAEVQKDFAGLMMHNVTVTSGKKIPQGTEGECIWLGVSKWLQPLAQITVQGEDAPLWIDPNHLTAGKPLSTARKSAIEAEQAEQSEKTVYMPGRCTRETDNGVTLRHAGFFRELSFSKKDVAEVGEMKDGMTLYEVPAWKIRAEIGQMAVDMLDANRETYEANVK